MSTDTDGGFGPGTGALARYLVDVEYDDLPDEVVERTRWHLLDTLGCVLYGTTTPWVRKVVAALDRMGETGVGAASVLGGGPAVAPARAALVNGTASHAMDYDDYCQDAGVHAGSAVLPCALAHCQAGDDPVSGEAFLASLAAGVEVGVRTGYGIGRESLVRGLHIAGWTGAFAGAATAGYLSDLDGEAMGHALAVAGTQGAGLMGATYGAEVKRFHMGKAAESGYVAAALGAEGFTGDARIFGDRWGSIGPTMSDDGDTDAMIDGLGEDYELLDKLTFKPHPGVGQTHPPITAVKEIIDGHGLDPADVERVTVRVTESAKDKSGWEYEPRGVMAAQGNIQYGIATLLVDGRVSIDAYTEEAIRRPEVLDRVGDVDVVADDSLVEDASGFNARYRTAVEVVAGGESYANEVDLPKGFPENPMSEAELEEKFREQAEHVLPGRDVDAVVDFVMDIEGRDDVSELVDLVR